MQTASTKNAADNGENDELDFLEAGVEVAPGPSHDVSYSPPIASYDDYDERLDAQLQQVVDAAVYLNELADNHPVVQGQGDADSSDGEEGYNAAYMGGAGDNIANDVQEGQPIDNQADVDHMEQQAGLMVISADNPHTHSRIFVQQGMWCVMVEARHPRLVKNRQVTWQT